MKLLETLLWCLILIGTAHVANKLSVALSTINTPFSAVAMAIKEAGK